MDLKPPEQRDAGDSGHDELGPLRSEIHFAIEQLEAAGSQRYGMVYKGGGVSIGDPEPTATLMVAMRSTLRVLDAVAATMLGACQMADPYAPLQPIIAPNGELRWCCTHDPQHCAP